jgi:L-arabinose isomerase
MKSLDDREVRFASGSQHLYGHEALVQVAKDSRKIAECGGRNQASRSRPRHGSTLAGRTIPASARRSPTNGLEDFAEIAGLDSVVIDAETRLRELRRQLR